MATFKPIGVLGGMGPQATILLQQRLVLSINADDDASHVPLLIDMNPQIPSRLDRILKQQGEDPGPVLADMARRLAIAGACALAMPCNTAHFYAPQITSAVDVPLLNMVELTGQHILETLGSGAKVGILASPAAQQVNLFKDSFEPLGLQVIYPNNPKPLLTAIKRLKTAGPTELDHQALQAAALGCLAKGADCLLVGCSEFSLIAHEVEVTVPVVDSLDVLVSSMVAFSISE